MDTDQMRKVFLDERLPYFGPITGISWNAHCVVKTQRGLGGHPSARQPPVVQARRTLHLLKQVGDEV